MGRTNWTAAVALLTGLMSWTNAEAETADPISLRVKVIDEMGIPDATLLQSQQEASRIYAAAGITLAWLPPQEPSRGSLIIKIVATPLGQKSRNRSVLGVALGSKEVRGRIAWLFYHRIHDLAWFYHLEVSKMLGHVMAHEMGHLLLPYDSYAAAGLMKGGWDNQQALLATTGSLTFEASQAALIRARLRAEHQSLIPNP